jgi:hypothetical protein
MTAGIEASITDLVAITSLGYAHPHTASAPFEIGGVVRRRAIARKTRLSSAYWNWRWSTIMGSDGYRDGY